jgi:uncharacterized protein (UPF0303 family)
MEEIFKKLLEEEQELQFTKFNETTAWKIGSRLVEQAMQKELPVTIDITRGDHQLFHVSLRGTSVDNDEWIKRKVRLVYRFGHSSFYMGQLLNSKGKSLEEAYLLSESQYAAHGGCFPVFLKETGMVGTITVSGLAQKDDHELVVQAIRDYLAKGE